MQLPTHPLTQLLLKFRLSHKTRQKIRRRFDALPAIPTNLSQWVNDQVQQHVKRREQAEEAARMRRQARGPGRERERCLALPRLPPWKICAAAAGKLQLGNAELHPEDEKLFAQQKIVIDETRRKRAHARQVRDPLNIWQDRYREAAAKRFIIRVAALRRRQSLDPLGRLLLALWDSQRASDQAKSRAAHGQHFSDYAMADQSDYVRANYRRSQEAKDRDYRSKRSFLRNAVGLSREANVPCGFREHHDHFLPYVIYFELSTGQVSFHTENPFDAPPYPGEWDGSDTSRQRIEAALLQYLRNNQPAKRRQPALKSH